MAFQLYNQTVVNLTTEVQSGVQEADFGNGAAEINPDDIESGSILKGLTASALYGTERQMVLFLLSLKRG